MPDSKERVLIYTNHPSSNTGMGRIAREVGSRLSEQYEIGYAGWGAEANWEEWANTYHIKKTNGSTEEELGAVVGAIMDFKPKYVLAMGDPWNFYHLQEMKSRVKASLPELRVVLVLTIDGAPMHPTWVPTFLAADALAVTSHFGKNVIEESKAVRAEVVPLGIDNKTFNNHAKSAITPPNRSQPIHRGNSFTVLWAGQNTSRKAPGSFIDIMADFLSEREDVYSMMCSQMESPVGSDLQAIINNHMGFPQDRMLFVHCDPVNHPSDLDLAHIYGAASVIVCTSLGEGNWMPGYEAQACGCVPIVNNHTALTETVGGRGILVAPATASYGEYDFVRYFCDKKKILNTLESLYDDWKAGGEKLKQLSDAGIEWAKEQSWDNTCDAILSLFEKSNERSVHPWIRTVQSSEGSVVSVCPTYGESCGIAEYTKGLNQSLTDCGTEPIIAKTKDVGNILALVRKSKPSIVHFQHEYGFWPYNSRFLDLLNELPKFGAHPIVTMHSVTMDHEYNSRLLRSPATILVHSEFMKTRINQAKIEGADVRVMPMGCFYQHKVIDRDKIRRVNNIPQDDFIVGSYGFLRPCKGYEVLVSGIIKANAIQPGVKALIYTAPHAFGSDVYEEWFLRMVEEGGASDHVLLFRDRRPKRDVINILGCCDLLVLAYLENAAGGGLSSAVKDCLVTGIPTVVTATPAFTDIPQEVAATIKQEDSEAVAHVITRARENPDLFKHFGVNGRKFCWDNRWSAVAQQHVELYQELEYNNE